MIKYKLENELPIYSAFGQAYVKKDDQTLQEVVSVNEEEFKKDKNYGLIKKLMKNYPKVRLQELSNTYLTLTFQ